MTAVRISGEVGGAGEFAVKSRSHPGLAYVIEVHPGPRVGRCRCLSFEATEACYHSMSVAVAIRAEPQPEIETLLQQSIDSLAEQQKRRAS